MDEPNNLPAIFPDLGERYEVLSLIGSGGMGTVYRVHDRALDSDFAVKVMNESLVHDKLSVKRFEQEAAAAKGLTHANLAAVYDFGMAPVGRPYLVMDYLDGQTLETTLKDEGFLDVPRAVDIFIQTAEAIADAHMKGVIHRDIKPANIILEKRPGDIDFVKLVDFGIAKVLPSQEQARANLTQTGDIFGSPLYMSPEQCQGNVQDRRSDIYSLGCVMYESLTGVKPFAAPNPIKTILKHVQGGCTSINLIEGDYKIPTDLDRVILHCLARDPEDRYQTADQLVVDLRKVRDGEKVVFQKIVKPVSEKEQLRLVSLGRDLFTGLACGMMALIVALYVCLQYVSTTPTKSPVILNAPATTPSRYTSTLAPGQGAYWESQELDQRSAYYYARGEYDKAAPLLEFGIAAYKDQLAIDTKQGDAKAILRDETLLAENWQHIGKCYLFAAEKIVASDLVGSRKFYIKAFDAYNNAVPFYYKYGSWPGGSTAEFVHDYYKVLSTLKYEKEILVLKEFAAKWKIDLPTK